MTPMLSQYLEIKKNHTDAILFYRMGDFYEMFFKDAEVAAPLLGVQLTTRDRNVDNPVPMCGVPFHSVGPYIQKLLNRGYKVALCEQVEDASLAKGLVRREVTRVLTPALVGDPDLVAEDVQNFLYALLENPECLEIAIFDLMSSTVRSGAVRSSKALFDLFASMLPREVLVSDPNNLHPWVIEMLSQFPNILITARPSYFKSVPPLPPHHVALKQYLEETQKSSLIIERWLPLCDENRLKIDPTTLKSLDVLSNGNRSETPSLEGLLDHTLTPMGRRTLRDWLSRPLRDLNSIRARHEAVQEFLTSKPLQSQIRGSLTGVRDLERLATKGNLGLAMPRDLVTIRAIQEKIPAFSKSLSSARSTYLCDLGAQFEPLPELTGELRAALEDTPPSTFREGGIFKESFHPEIAEYRQISKNAKNLLAALEQREKSATGIPSLKIKYSRVFGFSFEVTKSHLSRVPSKFIRKQTLAGGERFQTEELKELEDKIALSEYRLHRLEETLFFQLRDKVASLCNLLHKNARLIGILDVLLAFSEVTESRGYQRPEMHAGWDLEIRNGRHPVLEARIKLGEFVPNTVSFDSSSHTLVITGPNMAGKSTVMRQVALITLMAHAGMFVPAEGARIPLVDQIFTRVGASDDLASGRSTFMVEMTEVARILSEATSRSLILIDEIGRGTSTYDGLSLAWSVLEYLHNQVQAKVLFATHFHEVTILEKSLPGLKNVNVTVERWKDEIVFLHTLKKGICNRSYGIEVAKLSGLPPAVLTRARDILGVLETQSKRSDRARYSALETCDQQMAFFEGVSTPETQNRIEP